MADFRAGTPEQDAFLRAGTVALVMYAMTFLLGGFDAFQPFLSPFYNLTVIAMLDKAKELGVNTVFTNHDYEPSAIERDETVRVQLEKQGIGFETFKDQVIFEKKDKTANEPVQP